MTQSDPPAATMIDTRRADAAYRSFASFEVWQRATKIDDARWDRYARLLQHRAELTPELLARARDVAKRAAAVDTGAIEGLYDVDRGFTFSVAMQLASWEAQLEAKGGRVRSLIESQMSAYDFVLDFATSSVPIAEAWIRTLHEVICSAQDTYHVYTEIGLQEQSLPLGSYKVLPNHVLRPDGSVHSYSPVDAVPAEMQRLLDELRSPAFLAAHPVQQAAFTHHAFTLIHPFADGNGRVARALASVFTYRALSVPLVILSEHRNEYYAALSAADNGEYQPFVDFILARTLDSIQLVSETLKAAGVIGPVEAAAQLKQVYVTRGGFTHSEVDGAGYRIFSAFTAELRKQGNALDTSELSVNVVEAQGSPPVSPPNGYRPPVTNGSRYADFVLQTTPPAQVKLQRRVLLEVPVDSGREDDIVLRCIETNEAFEARVTEAHPAVVGTMQLRLAVFVHGFLGRAIAELTALASSALKRQGY